jgi:predicted dehydrogenase
MKKVRLAIVGAGSRGLDSYPQYAKHSPYPVEFAAVAEPNPERREKAVRQLGVPQAGVFSSWEELAARPQLADGVLIATQDQMHAGPAQAFLRKGYHILLEKPMATTEADCRAIIATRAETGRMLAVCHTMRYDPYSQTMKQLIASGRIGEVVGVHHIEPVGYFHIAHSYVRGNWRREDRSSSMLLAKCCHDLDILLYWLDRHCVRVSSFGSLGHFRRDCRPQGAADRCLDCPPPIESGCPYSAEKIYLRDRRNLNDWPNNVLTLDTSPEGITKALREGPYGRCVYASDNDVVDRQGVLLEFEGGIVVTFAMAGFTKGGGRETWVMGTRGELRGDMASIAHHDFLTDRTTPVALRVEGDPLRATGHAGDPYVMLSFIQAIAENNPAVLPTTPEVSLESHLMAFAAERARKLNTVETVKV